VRYDVPEGDRNSKDALGQMARAGSTSLVVFSTIAFLGAWVLPLLVKSPEDDGFAQRPPERIAAWLELAGRYKPDLLTTWICGHLIFSGSMLLAPFAGSYRFATALVAICGVPWTLAMWAPHTFLGVEVNKLSGGSESTTSYRPLSDGSSLELSELASRGRSSPRRDLEDGGDGVASTGASSTGELSGIYFGILNIYTTLPQFVGTFIGAIVFFILEPGKSPELSEGAQDQEGPSASGPNAISVCLFIGAISTLVAAYATWRLRYLN